MRIDPQKINDNVSDDLKEILSIDSVGEVIGYKINDGTDIGLIIKLNNGYNAWFFTDEINPVDTETIDSALKNRSIY